MSVEVVECEEIEFPPEGIQYTNLPKDIQQKVIDNNRDYNVDGIDWWDSSYYDFHEELKEYGLVAKTFYFSLDRQWNFEASGLHLDCRGDLIKKLQLLVTEDVEINISTTRYSRHDYVSVEVNHDEASEALMTYIKEAIENLFESFLQRLDREYDYLTSDECIHEFLESNNNYYDENGDEV